MSEQNYLDMLGNILNTGKLRADRTGVGTISKFGGQLTFDLSNGVLPLITSKKMHYKSVLVELLWLLRGVSNTEFLTKYGVTIWQEWADETGSLGPMYPTQWRGGTTGVDQIKQVISHIKFNPYSRRHVVSAWNVQDLNRMSLPPCHAFFQFYVEEDRLSCHLYQRSGDMFLGVPFNIASYSLLTHLVAKECGLIADKFIHSFGDAHIYTNHLPQVKEQLTRSTFDFPTVEINLPAPLLDFIDTCHEYTYDELKSFISLKSYTSHDSIKAEVAI